jgi:hypothetical protein
MKMVPANLTCLAMMSNTAAAILHAFGVDCGWRNFCLSPEETELLVRTRPDTIV